MSSHNTQPKPDFTQDQATVKSQILGADIEQERAKPQVISAGQWLRTILGSQAPFGRDGMPTVLG